MAGEQPSVAGAPEIICDGACSGCLFVALPGCPKARASKRCIKFDLSQETSRSAVQVIDIAREVARTEGNRLPGELCP